MSSIRTPWDKGHHFHHIPICFPSLFGPDILWLMGNDSRVLRATYSGLVYRHTHCRDFAHSGPGERIDPSHRAGHWRAGHCFTSPHQLRPGGASAMATHMGTCTHRRVHTHTHTHSTPAPRCLGSDIGFKTG